MQVETVPIASVVPDPANARRHGPRNLDAIKASLARFGQQKPIVIDAANVCRAGNGTLEAAKALGWQDIRCVRTPLAGAEATAYGIADNRTAELAEWDNQTLAGFLADPQIGNVGFTGDEIRKLLSDPEPPRSPAAGPRSVGESYQVAVECGSEAKQRELYERLTAEGLKCRLLTL